MLCQMVPDEPKSFRLIRYPVGGLFLMQTDNKGLNAWKVKVPEGIWQILGLSHEISGEYQTLLQSKEIYHENTYGEKPECDYVSGKNVHEFLKWQQAEKQVGNWLILIEK